MDRILIMILAVALGGGVGYFVSNKYHSDITVSGQLNISEPKIVNRVETTEIISRNTAVAIYENKSITGAENNAAMMLEWTSVNQIGVDFTNFPWKSLQGIGTAVPEEGTVKISGELPPLKLLNSFSEIGEEKETMISKIAKIVEEDVLRPVLLDQKDKLIECIGESSLYRTETIDSAHRVIVSLLGAAIPPRADGTPIVEFNLKFKNESELRAEIANLNGEPKICDSTQTIRN